MSPLPGAVALYLPMTVVRLRSQALTTGDNSHSRKVRKVESKCPREKMHTRKHVYAYIQRCIVAHFTGSITTE